MPRKNCTKKSGFTTKRRHREFLEPLNPAAATEDVTTLLMLLLTGDSDDPLDDDVTFLLEKGCTKGPTM